MRNFRRPPPPPSGRRDWKGTGSGWIVGQQDYRAQGWPAETPEYLLRGYFRLLLDTADVPRLIGCATDRARHDRMLDITGGDAVALTEITDVQDLLLQRGTMTCRSWPG